MDRVTPYVTVRTHPPSYPIHRIPYHAQRHQYYHRLCPHHQQQYHQQQYHQQQHHQQQHHPYQHYQYQHHQQHHHLPQYSQQQQQNINTNLNICTRACYSQLAGHLIPVAASGPFRCSFNVNVQHVPISRLETQQEITISGIAKEHLAKQPSYLDTKVTLKESDCCAVCMCEYEFNDRLRVLPCAHEFHSECVDKWLSINATCPNCRSVVKLT